MNIEKLFRFSGFKRNLTLDQFQNIDLSALDIDRERHDYFRVFQPVITHQDRPIRAAFLGLNAYANRAEFTDPTFDWSCFVESAQKKHGIYSAHLLGVLNLYGQELSSSIVDNGAFYYSNFVKLVLFADPFSSAFKVSDVLAKNPEITERFSQVMSTEIEWLYANGCRIFVGFGNDADHYLRGAYTNVFAGNATEVENVGLFSKDSKAIYVKNRHFSRYWRSQSSNLCAQITNDWALRNLGFNSGGFRNPSRHLNPPDA